MAVLLVVFTVVSFRDFDDVFRKQIERRLRPCRNDCRDAFDIDDMFFEINLF